MHWLSHRQCRYSRLRAVRGRLNEVDVKHPALEGGPGVLGDDCEYELGYGAREKPFCQVEVRSAFGVGAPGS